MLRAELGGAVGEIDLDVELTVEPGRCLALAGPSGAGKTTVLRMLAGLRRPERGEIECAGERWFDAGRGLDVAPERRRCGLVFQDHALFPHMSALRNVAYGVRGSRAGARTRALEELERLQAGHLADARPRRLSGGERQRVALARALAADPRALLLDEPLAALDARTRAHAARELGATLRDAGVPSILVTHDFTEAALLGDEIAVIDGGRIVQRGAAGELATKPASAFVADFTGAVVLTGHARPGEGGLTVVELDGGGTVDSTEPATGPVAVSVFPWEITLEAAPAAQAGGSARNRLEAEVVSLTTIANRTRVGLLTPQPLAAEITGPSAQALGLRPGTRVVASWKAAATRVVPL
jgi:molybdate transport system ATP-binding protein